MGEDQTSAVHAEGKEPPKPLAPLRVWQTSHVAAHQPLESQRDADANPGILLWILPARLPVYYDVKKAGE